MSTRTIRILAVTALAGFTAASATAAAQDVKVAPGAVDDRRSAREGMAGLSIELRLSGDAAADVKAIRPRLKSAKDDTGAVLLKPDPDAATKGFDEFTLDRQPKPKISLASPARGAATVDVAGDLELFIPKRDPNTSLKLEKFLSKLDKPLSNPALKSAKVELTPLSAKEYLVRQEKNKPTREQMVAEGKKHGASDEDIQKMIGLMEAFSKLGGEAPSETSVLLETKDPESRIMGIEVADNTGKEIHSNGRGSNGGHDLKLVKIDLAEKAPPDATLMVTLRTAKSVVTIPLNMKGVPLP